MCYNQFIPTLGECKYIQKFCSKNWAKRTEYKSQSTLIKALLVEDGAHGPSPTVLGLRIALLQTGRGQ